MQIENTNYVAYLIELSKEGRKKAFFDLCEINLKNVFTVSYRLLSNLDLAKKITLYTFLKAREKITEYDSKISFALWMKNLAVRNSIDKLRMSAATNTQIIQPDDATGELHYLESLINSLPTDDRIIFVLHDLEGYSYKEINNFFDEMIEDEIKTKLITSREFLMGKLNI